MVEMSDWQIDENAIMTLENLLTEAAWVEETTQVECNSQEGVLMATQDGAEFDVSPVYLETGSALAVAWNFW